MSIGVQNLVKRYGDLAVVHGISFEVGRGEFVSLLGPSGCGKTTTLRCIAGLEDADGGVIRIADEVVSAPDRGVLVPAHDRHLGMVFQSYAIWPHMSVAQNVGFPLTIRKVSAAEVARQVDDAGAVAEVSHASQEPAAEQLDVVGVRSEGKDLEAVGRIGRCHGFKSFRLPEKGSHASRTRRVKAREPRRHA